MAPALRAEDVHEGPGRPLERPRQVERTDERPDLGGTYAAPPQLRRDGHRGEAERDPFRDVEEEERGQAAAARGEQVGDPGHARDANAS
jgi:hypothetical protein